MLRRRIGMMRCLVCQVALTDPLFALAHSCQMAQDDVSTRMIERDKKDRADFLRALQFPVLSHQTSGAVV